MTTEEKAKAYEMALEGARKELGVDRKEWEVIEQVLKSIFPELRESEDERIRKTIKECITHDCSLSEEETNKCLDYLEKQKENPKSADSIPSDCVSDAKCEDKSPKHSDSDWTDIRDTPAYWKGWDDAMKQKEQKHPNGCFTCDEYKKGYESGRLNGFTAGYNKAMKEIDQKEQKPTDRFEEARKKYQVEWSEEDEKMRNLIVAIFEVNHPDGFFKANKLGDTDMRGVHTEEIISWLKSLRPSWKPSEQEKGALRTAIHILTDERSFPKAAAQLQNILNAFEGKESRKDWKPSEEQMDAFRSYIGDFQEKAEAAVGGWNNFDVMIRLFEQLQRLM